jgi:hypothetical protein
MEMRYFWLLDQSVQQLFDFQYHPGLENLADYHHPSSHHTEVRPYYVHNRTLSQVFIAIAAKPSVRRGCVIPDKDTKYLRKYPLSKLTRVGISQVHLHVEPVRTQQPQRRQNH